MKENAQQEEEWWTRRLAQYEDEWLAQYNLIYGSLIAGGLIMVQPFLTVESLDLSAKICVVAFSAAIPLLAALVMVNRHETLHRRALQSGLVNVTRTVAQVGAFIGLIAGFWHIMWIAGVAILAGGIVGTAVYTSGTMRLERTESPPLRKRENPSARRQSHP